MSAPTTSRPAFFFGGQITDLRQHALAVRATTDLIGVGPVHVRYSAQVQPIIWLSGVERYQSAEFGRFPLYIIGGKDAAYGFGASPIGLELALDLGSRLRLSTGTAAGIAWFSQHIPTAAGASRNFTAEWDARLSYRTTASTSLDLGLRWKHTSNGFTAFENPGFDNRMIVAGFTTRIGRKR